MDEPALVRDLDPEQRAAVMSDSGLLCIVAPAGSGKTRVLTRRIARRIADHSADADHVLVVTFTRRAAAELTTRLRALGQREAVTAGTFHGLAYRLLRQRWEDQRRRAPSLLTNRVSLVEELLARDRGGPVAAQEVASEIDWARARRVAPADYRAAAAEAGRRTSMPPARLAGLYEQYEELKQQRRLVDFDDLLSLTLRELRRDPAYAAAVRWRFRHLFVDEFQDVNPLQHALLEAWRGERADLCVVGDPDQAIYGWNGADGRWLQDFTRLHPGATVVHLRRSHRSTPQIVGLGHAVLTGEPAGGPEASRPEGPSPRTFHFADQQAESRGVAGLVREARPPGGRWRAIAVLARTNAQLEAVAAALDAAGIPARTRRTASDDPAVASALYELRSVRGPGSLRSWLDESLAADEPQPLPDGLVRAAEDLLAQDPSADGPALRTWLSTGGGGDVLDGRDDAVALLTFHAAKGLEWPTVVLVGLVPGLVPHGSARTAAALDEERRLFHVAVTRAEHELLLTWFGPERTPWLASLDLPEEPVSPPPASLLPQRQPEDPALAALRRWRRDAARAARIDETTVLDDATLDAVVAAAPSSIEELAAVPGFGPLMARRHGTRLLAALAAGRPVPAPAGRPRPGR